MKLSTRRAIFVLGLAALAAAPTGIYSRIFGRKRLRFPYLTGTLSAGEYERLAAKSGWSVSRIAVTSEIFLNGLVRRPISPDAPWVLFYQGNDAHMLRGGQAFLSNLAAKSDWGLAVFAYRGYDSSPGHAQLKNLAADAPEILEQLCAVERIDRSRLHVVGFSIGGYFAVRAIAVAAQLKPKPASLTLLAAVDDIVMVPRSPFDRLLAGDDFQTHPYLDAVPAPVLVIQGDQDEALLGPAQGRAISAKLGSRARYIELPGIGHSALLDNSTALMLTRDFITASHANEYATDQTPIP